MKKLVLFAALLTGTIMSHAQPSTVTLRGLRDHQRALLVFGNGNNAPAEQQLLVAAKHVDGFRERDLLLVGLAGSNDAVPTALLSAADDAAARSRFHVRQGEFTVILIGKDGGEKLRSHTPLSWEKLRDTIDSMPMRQSEMQTQSR